MPCVQDFDSERPQPACPQEEMPSPEKSNMREEMRMGMDGDFFGRSLLFGKKTHR